MQVELNQLHDGQQHIIDNRKRFNVVCCGRRFGKTAMAVELCLDDELENGALKGHKIAYMAPSYKMLEEVWLELLYRCKDIIKSKNESAKRVVLITGGTVDFWSMDNIDSIRGRKYKRVILDEASILNSKKLKDIWEQSIRPLLTDLKGDAYFLSTPKGKKHYFRELAENYKKYPKSWAFFQMPTLSNPYIDPAEVEEARQMLPPVVFAQEYEAEFTDMVSDNLFIQTFSKDKHVSKEPIAYNPSIPTYISIDFNVSPLCCIVVQMDLHFRAIHIINEYRQMDSDVYELCDWIKSNYDSRRIFITGDAAGFNRSAYSRSHQSAFQIIQTELNLNWSQVKTPRGKPSGYVNNKRLLGNALFAKHPNLLLSNVPWLVEDLLNVECDSMGQMNKSRDSTQSHLLDSLLDFFFSCCQDAVKMPTMRG